MSQNKKQWGLIRSILSLSIDISNTTITDIFTDYYGHVNGFCVRVYIEGWEKNKPADLNVTVYLENDCISTLQMVENTLKNIKEDFKNEYN
jgi:hypothetical protein